MHGRDQLFEERSSPVFVQSLNSDEVGAVEDQPILDKSATNAPTFQLSLKALGPALVCCLADGDAGSLIVAAQSGTKWRYSLIFVQVMLIPVLFMVLEALVRTGVSERKGFGAMLRHRFGMKCATMSLVLLLVSCFGAVLSEMSGVASVAQLWGIKGEAAMIFTAAFVVCIVVCCGHRHVELVAMLLGCFEFAFVMLLFYTHPRLSDIFMDTVSIDIGSVSFLRLLSANIGAVVMPWMIYYQQSSVVARRVTTPNEVAQQRTESLLGSIVTQIIMIATMIVVASSPRKADNLKNIFGFQEAIRPLVGPIASKIIISCAFGGGSICAMFVASLAAAWAVCDTFGQTADDTFSLDKKFLEAPKFYSSFVCIVALSAILLTVSPNVVKLNVYIELVNAMTVPLALLLLFLVVTSKDMIPALQISGMHKHVLTVLFVFTSSVSVTSSFFGLLPQ
jgi:Mn2+/Fe2+ NRAMP family transporter